MSNLFLMILLALCQRLGSACGTWPHEITPGTVYWTCSSCFKLAKPQVFPEFSRFPAAARITGDYENRSHTTHYSPWNRNFNQFVTQRRTPSHKTRAHCVNRENLANFSLEKNDGVKSPFFTASVKFLIVENLLFFKFVSSYSYAFYNHYVHSSIVQTRRCPKYAKHLVFRK